MQNKDDLYLQFLLRGEKEIKKTAHYLAKHGLTEIFLQVANKEFKLITGRELSAYGVEELVCSYQVAKEALQLMGIKTKKSQILDDPVPYGQTVHICYFDFKNQKASTNISDAALIRYACKNLVASSFFKEATGFLDPEFDDEE